MSFSDTGYILYKSLLDKKTIESLQKLQNENFPDYQSGLKDFGKPVRENKYYSESVFDKDRKTRFDGIPLAHRIFRGQGSPELNSTPNILYGKRASRRIINLPIKYDEFLFNPELIEKVKQCLDSKSVYFNLASANRVYPKYQGESGILHIDTYGFTNNKNEFTSEYLLNMIIYINGTDQGRSGTKLIPHSHKWYKEINKRVANSLNLNDNLNRIHQREAYLELFTDEELSKAIKVEASPGDVLMFRSDLFHCIPKNFSETLHRDVMIANFSSSKDFSKSYSANDVKLIEKRIRNYKDVKFAYKVSSSKNLRFLKAYLKNKLKSSIKYIHKIILEVSKSYKSIPANLNKKDLSKLRILNLGAGPFFSQQDVISLDHNDIPEKVGIRTPTNTDIDFDLSENIPLPFENERFEAIYTSHCMEHLTISQVEYIFREVHRILMPGGIFRILVPNIELYFDKYDSKDLSFFNWIRNKSIYRHDSWLRFIVREFAGAIVDDFEDDQLIENYKVQGRSKFIENLNNLSNNCLDKARNIPDIHKSGWSNNSMIFLLKKCSFSEARPSIRHESQFKKFREKSIYDNTRPNISLYIEAKK